MSGDAVTPDTSEGIRWGCHHLDNRFEDSWPENFDTSVSRAAASGLEAIQRLVARDVRAVLLSGPVGCGKSHLAAIACNLQGEPLFKSVTASDRALGELETRVAQAAGLERGAILDELAKARRQAALLERQRDRECPRWIPVPRYLAGLRGEMSMTKEREADQATIDLLGRPASKRPWRDLAADTVGVPRSLLVLDDLGSEKASEWTRETLFELVASRYDAYGQIVVTTNLSAAQLTAAGYGRIVSRMADEGIILEMRSGKDYRQRNRRNVA